MIYWYDKPMGKAFGRMYLFESAGDALPRHAHAPDEEHNVIVLAGQVHVQMERGTLLGLRGDLIEFDSSKEHLIYSLIENTKTLHLYLNGRPNWYDGQPTSGSFPGKAAADSSGA